MASPEPDIDPEEPDFLDEPSTAEAEQELSIGSQLSNWKTIVSFAFAIALIVVIVIKGNIDPHSLWQRLRTLNVPVFLLAFVVYYLTFPIRGYRWKVLLQNAYRETHSHVVDDMSLRGLTEILYISWFVNCVVPAKLGDLYRAYLAKLWARISWTKTVGTIVAERLIDILVLSVLLAITSVIVFHNRLGKVGIVLFLGVGLAVLAVALLVVMKTMSERIRTRMPARIRDRYVAFEEGTLHSFQRLPLLLGVTVVIWLLEGARYQLVFTSLGLHSTGISPLPFAPMLFFALGTAVLTTIPFTPGGLGLVEILLLTLMVYLGLHKADAAAVILVDRLLSYYSIAFFGFIVYLLSKRSHFRQTV
jgi:uncharacterized protein (TIRG00374 family)